MGPIELTVAEQGLWDQIYFHRGGILDDDRLRASIEPAYELACSLLERDAIPPIRWRYFTDPELNVGGHGKSRLQVFERNGTRGDAVLRHPHFHKYLRYFVLGPDLPASTTTALGALVDECAPVTSGDVDGFCALARSEVRSRGLDRRLAAEEFFKVALELALDEGTARIVRDSVMEMRTAYTGFPQVRDASEAQWIGRSDVDDDKRHRHVTLVCPACGSSQFSDDEEGGENSIVTCTGCARQMTQDDLIRENSENLEAHAAEMADEAIKESVKQFNKSLRDAFKGNKNIGFK